MASQTATQVKSWKHYARLAKHYKAIGNTEIYLNDGTEFPWGMANSVESGGMHRLSIPVSFTFRADDPQSGLSFRWFFDLEAKGANGSGKFHIDIERIRQVREMLPDGTRKSFSRILRETSVAVRKQGDDYQKVAADQYAVAAELERL